MNEYTPPTNEPVPAINVEHISKQFQGVTVVNDLSLKIMSGEIFGFLGPNGSGKTTAIRMLCGLLTPNSGSGTCLGYNILTESLYIKEHTGYMAQKFSLYEDLTPRENLDFMARMYNLPNRAEAVQAALTKFGLLNQEKKLTGTLSGGFKQRVALAACLMHKPQLLLLDEPTAGVDPLARREFWDIIQEMSETHGITSLVSTHYMDEALRCHRLGYIAWGDLITVGSPQELIDHYQEPTLEAVFVHLMRMRKAQDPTKA